MWRNDSLYVPLKPKPGTGDHYLLYLSMWRNDSLCVPLKPEPGFGDHYLLYLSMWRNDSLYVPLKSEPGFGDHYLLYLSAWRNGSLAVPLKPEQGLQSLGTITCCISLREGMGPSQYPWNLNKDTRVWGPLPVVSLYVKEWVPRSTPETWTRTPGFGGTIITYLVSSRRSIEIRQVCKIYGRRGGAEPSIYFTNPPYFYRPSGTDQISVLFRRGPCIVYTVTKIRKKSPKASYIYGRILRAKMWRYGFRGRRHRLRGENQGRHDVMPLLKLMTKSNSLRCETSFR